MTTRGRSHRVAEEEDAVEVTDRAAAGKKKPRACGHLGDPDLSLSGMYPREKVIAKSQ
jgi:predicted secreted protein